MEKFYIICFGYSYLMSFWAFFHNASNYRVIMQW